MSDMTANISDYLTTLRRRIRLDFLKTRGASSGDAYGAAPSFARAETVLSLRHRVNDPEALRVRPQGRKGDRTTPLEVPARA